MSTGHVNDWVRYAGNEPLDGPTMYVDGLCRTSGLRQSVQYSVSVIDRPTAFPCIA